VDNSPIKFEGAGQAGTSGGAGAGNGAPGHSAKTAMLPEN
jgi:hypothetical protein